MIGTKDKGLSAMFTMMNLERIVVGIQGLGISEIAYQNSLAYAKERKQGKTNNSKSNNGADFIIEHADIRRSLLNMKSIIEGERALSPSIIDFILSKDLLMSACSIIKSAPLLDFELFVFPCFLSFA